MGVKFPPKNLFVEMFDDGAHDDEELWRPARRLPAAAVPPALESATSPTSTAEPSGAGVAQEAAPS